MLPSAPRTSRSLSLPGTDSIALSPTANQEARPVETLAPPPSYDEIDEGNRKREPAARWDAYLYVPDPDSLAAEFASRNVEFSEPLKDTHDGLRGFELKDSDGYVLFFGRPRS